MDAISADLRYAMRLLRRQPGFAAIAILTMALGIGATTTLFSVWRMASS
jgi:putative ABC transport system permease protein